LCRRCRLDFLPLEKEFVASDAKQAMKIFNLKVFPFEEDGIFIGNI